MASPPLVVIREALADEVEALRRIAEASKGFYEKMGAVHVRDQIRRLGAWPFPVMSLRLS